MNPYVSLHFWVGNGACFHFIYLYNIYSIYIYSIYPPKTSRCWKQACGLRVESHSQVRSSWSLSQQALLAQVIHMCSRSTSRTSADASPTLHDTSGIPSYTRLQMWPPHLSVGRESSEGRCGWAAQGGMTQNRCQTWRCPFAERGNRFGNVVVIPNCTHKYKVVPPRYKLVHKHHDTSTINSPT